MAWSYQLWIESDKGGMAIRNHFLEQKEISIGDCNYTIKAFESCYTGSMITVDKISTTGIHSEEDAKEMTSIGFEFLERLKTAPYFRFAVIGVEVDAWIEIEDLYDDSNYFDDVKGFVINKQLYQEIGSTVQVEDFNSNNFWIPYEGERYTRRK